MRSRIVNSDFSGLNALVKWFGDGRVVRVGILKGKTDRKNDAPASNADLGAIHEYGSFTRNIPARSWLRMPIVHRIKDVVKKAINGLSLSEMSEGGRLMFLRRLGVACEGAIQEAFATRGFGSWAPDKPATIRRKSRRGKVGDAPLIDTGQMRRAVDSEVGEPR